MNTLMPDNNYLGTHTSKYCMQMYLKEYTEIRIPQPFLRQVLLLTHTCSLLFLLFFHLPFPFLFDRRLGSLIKFISFSFLFYCELGSLNQNKETGMWTLAKFICLIRRNKCIGFSQPHSAAEVNRFFAIWYYCLCIPTYLGDSSSNSSNCCLLHKNPSSLPPSPPLLPLAVVWNLLKIFLKLSPFRGVVYHRAACQSKQHHHIPSRSSISVTS